ncbi:MAG: hypothetical protein WDO24_29035 [Pseudomonadota bacterium]
MRDGSAIVMLKRAGGLLALAIGLIASLAGAEFSSGALDLDVAQLPPGYQGHDLKQLLHVLSLPGRNQAAGAPLLGSLTADATYAFAFKAWNPARARYDATRGTVDLMAGVSDARVPISRLVQPERPRDGVLYAWEIGPTKNDSYVGTSMTGVAREIDRSETESWALGLCRRTTPCPTMPVAPFRFALARDAARGFEATARFLVIGKLATPKAEYDIDWSRPKAGHLSDRSNLTAFVSFAPEAVWIYAIDSGQILAKIALTSPAAGKSR